MGEGALGEPDGVESGEEGGGDGGGGSGEALGEAEDGCKGCGGDEADEGAGGEGGEAGEVPPEIEENGWDGWMDVSFGERANEDVVVEEIPGCRDVVGALVPVVGKTEKRDVGEEDSGKEEGEQRPEGCGRLEEATS